MMGLQMKIHYIDSMVISKSLLRNLYRLEIQFSDHRMSYKLYCKFSVGRGNPRRGRDSSPLNVWLYILMH